MKSYKELYLEQANIMSTPDTRHTYATKWEPYFDIYETYIGKYRNTSPTFVEVGVSKGLSLSAWKEYFNKGSVLYGIDLYPQINKIDGVFLIKGDQSDPKFWDAFVSKVEPIDVFLDDGSHENSHQITTFMKVWPHIKEGGVFICEDTHTSYWDSYGGGLLKPTTFIEFSKSIIDILHVGHVVDATPNKELYELCKNIGTIHFYDSMVIFIKGKPKFIPVK